MSHLFISTSRKPNDATRRLSHWLASLLNAEHRNRGKYSVEEVVDQAEKAGRTRVLFVYDFKGNPGEMAAFDTDDTWVSPAVRIDSCILPEDKPRRYVDRVTFEGHDAKKWENILGYDSRAKFKEEGEDAEWGLVGEDGKPAGILIRADKSTLSFYQSGRPLGPVIKYHFKELKRCDEEEEKKII